MHTHKGLWAAGVCACVCVIIRSRENVEVTKRSEFPVAMASSWHVRLSGLKQESSKEIRLLRHHTMNRNIAQEYSISIASISACSVASELLETRRGKSPRDGH